MFNPWIILAIVIAFVGVSFGAYKKGDKDATNRVDVYWQAKEVIAQEAARAEEARRGINQAEALNDQHKALESAKRDANVQRNAVDELRGAIDTFLRNRSSNSTATGSSSAAATLGELFGHCNQRYGIMADEATAARIAGQLCEKYYDSNLVNQVKSIVEKRK